MKLDKNTMKNITKSLQEYYNHQAKKYAQTRRKFWSEKNILLATLQEYVSSYKKKKIRILEFGCGDGRFLREVLSALILENKNIQIEYIGVDISQGLLDIAYSDIEKFKKEKKIAQKRLTTTLVCADILKYIQTCEQESFDLVVGIASFQHIKTYRQRLYLMQYFYRILSYDGILLMVNWSFSEWFVKKYWKAILGGIKNYLLSFGNQERNSLYLPRKSNDSSHKISHNQVFYRFYHIFLLKEFKKLVLFSSFTVKKLQYIDRKGVLIDNFRDAKNSFFLAQKGVLE